MKQANDQVDGRVGWAWLAIAALAGGSLLVVGDSSAAGELVITQVAVRQGDAAVIQGPCGELGLIDTNRFREDEVLAVMDGFGTRELKWTSVSHFDADHVGGIVGVATAPGVSVGTAYDRGGDRNAKDSDTYRDYFDWATSAATTRNPLDIGDFFSLCSGPEEVSFEVVSVGTDGTAAGGVAVSEENDKGVCLKIEFGSFDAATCGDVNGTDEGSRTDVESAVAAAIGDVEFAKINHHGSAFSSNSTFVETLKAQASVVSTGANGFGHPDPAVLARWDEIGDVYRTQDGDNAFVDGNVTVTTDGQSQFSVETSTGTTRDYALDEGPSPSTTPTGTPLSRRSVTLTLVGHLKAKGVVETENVEDCEVGVEVRVQRKGSNGWRTKARPVTDGEGEYKNRLADRTGRYRAVVGSESFGGLTCMSATSPVIRHRH